MSRKNQQNDQPKKKKSSISKIYGYISKKIENQIQNFRQQKSFITAITNKFQKSGLIVNPKMPQVTEVSYQESLKDIKRKRQSHLPVANQQLLKLQIQKCYKNIPQQYLQQKFELGLTIFHKNKSKCQQKIFELNDYVDQIEFNLHCQVQNKFSEFVKFINSTNSMNTMIDQNLHRLQEIRILNKNTHTMVIDKVNRISNLRIRLDNLKKIETALKNLKRLNDFPQQINSLFLRDKPKALELLSLYDQSHSKNKIYCCQNKQECKFIVCRENVKINLQIAFRKSFWNYITQIIGYDKSALKAIFYISQREFQTSPSLFNNVNNIFGSIELEQSVWEDQPAQIIIKQNIEEEINWIANHGFTICNFNCGQLLRDLKQYMNDFQKDFLTDLIEKIKQSLNMQIGNSLFNCSKSQKVLMGELQNLVDKIPLNRYVKTIQLYCDILRQIITRCFSIVHRIICTLIHRNVTQSDVFQSNLLKIVQFMLEFTNQKLSSIFRLKKIPIEFELQNFKELIRIFQQWQTYCQSIDTTYVAKLIIFNINTTEVRQKLKMRSIELLKKNLMQNYLSNLHKSAMNKQLRKAMQDDCWQEIDIDSKYYESIGYIIEGQKFMADRKNRQLLNSSLLIEKKQSAIKQETQENHQFKVTQNQIIIKNRRFKTTSSTLILIEIIEQYLKIYDVYKEDMVQQITFKLNQLLIYYNSYLCQLILGTTAVHFNKIKGKNITARHMVLCYLSLEFLLCLLPFIKAHLKSGQQQFTKLNQKLWIHQQEIIKKFNSIIIYKITQELKEVSLPLKTPSKGTYNIVQQIRGMYEILSQYYEDQIIRKFIPRDCVYKYLERMNKLKTQNPNQAYIKTKQIQYFCQQTEQYRNAIPDYEMFKTEILSSI